MVNPRESKRPAEAQQNESCEPAQFFGSSLGAWVHAESMHLRRLGGAMVREIQVLTVSLVFLFLGAIVFGVIH